MEELSNDRKACVKMGLTVFGEQMACTAQRPGHWLFTVWGLGNQSQRWTMEGQSGDGSTAVAFKCMCICDEACRCLGVRVFSLGIF